MWSRKFLLPRNLSTKRYFIYDLIAPRVCRFSKHVETRQQNMEDLFLDNRVRYLLKALTGYDPMKIFSAKSLNNLESPKYRFMTDEQLKMEIEQADQRADSMLQMPPVKYPEEHEPQILEKDEALKGFLDSSVKLVFMDATAGFSDNERLIVVRESDGTLRETTRDERHRTNQIFYPIEERHIDYPQMFEEPHLTAMMDRKAYKLLLDNVCLHFEPEDPRYVELCHKTYQHIADNENFDCLWSTRHYGGMVFHYAYQKQIDPLLYYLLSMQKINDANNLLRLYYIINPRDDVCRKNFELDIANSEENHSSVAKIYQTESNKQISMDKFIEFLKIYMKNDSNSNLKSRLELLLQKFQTEINKQDNKNVAQN